MLQANEVLGEDVFKLEDWSVIGEYVYDVEGGRHQAFYTPKRDIHFNDIIFKAEERIQVEQSLKYSPEAAAQLWNDAGLQEVRQWRASSDAYSKYQAPGFILVFGVADRVMNVAQHEALSPLKSRA